MKNILASFPDEQSLLRMFPDIKTLSVNAHIHTPYSFSAFTDIPQIFKMARQENISVLGINDFFVSDGYEPFYHEAMNYGVFPLFNIEFIALLKKEQQEGIRVNDPNNPGRCYFSGKGLHYPFRLNEGQCQKLDRVIAESQDQVRAMINRANDWFARVHAGIILNFDAILKNYAKELVRERHVAKAIRIAAFEKSQEETQRNALFAKILGGKALKSKLSDMPGLENEIRGNLLKAGGPAFVEEDENAFMSIDEVIAIIVDAGGIPCYPVLLDDKNGNYTEYEKNPESLWQDLRKKNIGCIELIPGRNDAVDLNKFVGFFHDKGFVILLGTEHNAPDMIPLTCDTRDRKPLTPEIQKVSYEGSCVVAAHQYLNAKGFAGFVDAAGIPQLAEREALIKLGNAVIHHFIHSFKTDN